MSDTIDQLRDDLRAAIDAAVAVVPDTDRLRFARHVERAGQHLAAGKMQLAQVDLLTLETVLWTVANDRAKQLRTDLFAALVRAAVNGIVLA